jgi:hypothetical protein
MQHMQHMQPQDAVVVAQMDPGLSGFPTRIPRHQSIPPGFLSTDEAAFKLGITVESFRSRFGARSLPGTVRRGNRILIAESAIETELTRRAVGGQGMKKPSAFKQATSGKTGQVPVYDGATTSRAVALFMTGKPICDVIVELKITFEVAEHLWKKYSEVSRAFIIDSKSSARLHAILDDWTEETGPRLVEAVVRFQRRMVREMEIALSPSEQVSPEEFARIQREAIEGEASKIDQKGTP